MNGSPTVSGTVEASGGVLDLNGNLVSSSTAFDVAAASGSVLEISGTVASGDTLTLLGASGAIELTDVSGGIVQGFAGTIKGLNVGTSTTVPTNEIDINATVTKAVLSGNTITVSDSTTTVAKLVLASTPASGAYALFQTDTTLGGVDVFLSDAPPTVTIEGTMQVGQTLTADVTNPDPNATLGYQWQSSSNGGTTWTSISGANADTYTVQSTDSSHLLDVVVTSSDGNSATSAPTGSVGALTERLVDDSGASPTDGITNDDALTGTADPNTLVTFVENGTTLGYRHGERVRHMELHADQPGPGHQHDRRQRNQSLGTLELASLTFTYDTVAPGEVPDYSHIVVVVEENENYDTIVGNPDAPFINSLIAGGASLTNMDSLMHPSQPNYFALYAGQYLWN